MPMYCETSYCIVNLNWLVISPIAVDAQSERSTVLEHSNTGIVGSDTTRSMCVCLRFSLSRCPV
jgi:hypothetical protein